MRVLPVVKGSHHRRDHESFLRYASCRSFPREKLATVRSSNM
jgi:hypothetical protein